MNKWWYGKIPPALYCYDTEGVYTHSTPANPSPLEPNVWLIPAMATMTPVPDIGAGECAVWTGSAWEIKNIPGPEPEPTRLPRWNGDRKDRPWE